MKRFLVISIGSIWAFITALTAYAAEPLLLNDYYRAALRRSEVVAVQQELITQAQERYEQATSALLPNLDGAAVYTRQYAGNDRLAGTSRSERDRMVRITATQPLFRGFREFAALRQTKALLRAQRDDYRHARVELFKDVAQNFYDVLALEQDIKNLESQIEQNILRETEVRERTRIGRAPASEALTVQSAISNLRAEMDVLQGQLLATREVFAFLSGLDAAAPLRDNDPLPSRPQPLDEYLRRTALRPDVRAALERTTAAEENRAVARGAHLPSIDLSANRYFEHPDETGDIEWDVQLALTVPLYTGGAIQSRVREAESQRVQAELNASRITRQAQQEIRSAYQNAIFDLSRLDSLEKATEAARRNYDAQRRDYRRGLVNNLDVLQALEVFQSNLRALDRARFNAKLNRVTLQAAAMHHPALTQEEPAQ